MRSLMSCLGLPSQFVEKAPEKVVAEAKAQLEELEGKIAAVDEKVAAMMELA